MTKWEYLYRRINELGELPMTQTSEGMQYVHIDQLGAEGWELVAVDNGVAYFKRPIEDISA